MRRLDTREAYICFGGANYELISTTISNPGLYYTGTFLIYQRQPDAVPRAWPGSEEDGQPKIA